MKIQDVQKLNNGDQVYWNDPDKGLCSRYYTISAISISNDIITIVDIDGSILECFANELS